MGQYRTEIGTAEVCDMLCRLGATANYRGFSYTAYAVLLCVQQQDRLLLVTKWLYPDVAKRYGTNWKAVERNIRTVIIVPCWRDWPAVRCFSAPARRSSCPSCPTASCASRGRDRCRAEKEHKKRQSGPGSASRSAAPPVLFWPVPPHDPGRGQAEIWRERKFR